MKKIIILFICLLTISGCSKKEEIDINEIKELVPKFIYSEGLCRIDEAKVFFMNFNRYDEVEIINEDDIYYYINYQGLELAIDKNYIRKDMSYKFEGYTGYTTSNSYSYKNIFDNTVEDVHALNDEVKVIDAFLDWVVVLKGEDEVYMKANTVSKTKIVIRQYNPTPTPTPTPTPPSSSDGEDIELSYSGNNNVVLLADETNNNGYVLAGGLSSYIAFLNRNDAVKILESSDTDTKVLINGRIGYINRNYIRFNDEEEFVSFDRYAKYYSVIYKNFALNSAIRALGFNEVVKVIDEVEGRYVIELSDGTVGYISSSFVSKSANAVYVAPKPTPAPVSDPESEWTDPVM